MKRFYCTYFDKNYLVKAVAMITSLRQHSSAEVQIFAVCHDEISRVLLDALQLPGVVTVPMHEIERGDEVLLAAKHSRQLVEYFWTCTPTIILRLLERNPAIKQITYLDADLFFYSDPEPVFTEMGDAPVLIHEHRFPAELAYLQPQAGRFNVGLLSFCQNDQAFSVLKWWRARCNEWCYMHYEAGKMGDQLYLDQWPALFPFVKILQHIGAGVAPWNHQQYAFDTIDGQVKTNQSDLIFYHFHAFSRIKEFFYAPVKHSHYPVTIAVLQHVFVPYMDAVEAALLQVRAVSAGFNFGVNETANAKVECVLVSKNPDIFTELNWQDLAGGWLVAVPETKVIVPASDETLFSLNGGERLLDYIARPDIAAQIKQVYFVGCHYFEERDWFFNSFPALEKIYLFEPLPQVYATLVQNFGKDPRVQIFPFAISDQDGTAKFNVTNNLQSSSLLDLKLHKDIFPYVEKSNEVTVVVRSLDSVIREYDLPLPDLLYIDVQGAEYQALQGALELALPHAAVVYTEASTIEMYAGAHTLTEVDELMAGVHFRLLGFQDMLATRVHGDALFINQNLYQRSAHPVLARAHQHNLLAQTLIRQGRPEDAESELRKAMSEGASLAITLENLGKLALIGGDRALAAELFASARQISPNDRALLLLWAHSSGRAAFEACQSFINQHPGDTAFFDLASMRLRQSPPVPRAPAAVPARVQPPVAAPVRPVVKPCWQRQEWNSRLQKIWVLGNISPAELAALLTSFTDRAQFDVFLADEGRLQTLFAEFASEPRIALRRASPGSNVLSGLAESPDFLYFASAVDAAVALLDFDIRRLHDVSMVAIADAAPSGSENVRVMADYLLSQQFDWQASFAGQPALNLALFVNQRALAVMTMQRAKVQLLNLDAAQHLQQGRIAQAQELLDQALEEDPLYARTYLNWGRSCELAGQPQAALDSYVHALSLDEEDRSSALALGQLLQTMGHPAEAEEILTKFAEQVPADDIVARSLARSKPRISALVSTYKSAEFIAECLDDLLAQTISDQIEIIVIDANSPENEGEIVAAYQARHSNIRYVRTPERIGIYPAWNMAIEMAQGDYLISASTNDRLCKNSCEILLAELDADPQLAVVYGDSHFTRLAHQEFDTAVVQDGQYWPPYTFEMLLVCCMVGCHPMWRRSLHAEMGLFDESYVAIGDQDMWLRFAEKYPLKHIDFVTGLFWKTDDSLSGNADVAGPEINRVHQLYQQRYAYRQFLAQSALNQQSLNHYSQRINSAGRTLKLQLFILDETGDSHAVAQTMNSVTRQYYQGDLQLTIVSVVPLAAGHTGKVQYQQYSGEPWTVINRLVEDTAGDCLGVVRAGDELAPQALLMMLDALLFTTQTRLVYANEDQLEKSGLHSQPRFFAGEALNTIFATGFARFALLERDSFIALGGFKEGLHEYALRLFKQNMASALTHLDAVLYHQRNNAAPARALPSAAAQPLALPENTGLVIPKVAVILHLGSLDLWPDLAAQLKSSASAFDLFVTANSAIYRQVMHAVAVDFPGAQFVQAERRGSHIAPFLLVISQIDATQYEYICKLHTPDTMPAEGWGPCRARLLSLLPAELKPLLSRFVSEPDLGILAAADSLRAATTPAEVTLRYIRELEPRLAFDFAGVEYEYPRDALFWFRGKAFLDLGLFGLSQDDFDQKPAQEEGSLAEALEYLFPLLAFKNGFMTRQVGEPGNTKNPTQKGTLYTRWLEQQLFSRAQAALMDQYFAQHGEPALSVFIIDREGNQPLIIQTINSITRQLYGNVSIVVFSPLENPAPQGGIGWIQTGENPYSEALEFGRQSPADWLGYLEAGDQFLQNGLLLAMQQIVQHPEWQVVYCDDDVLMADGEPDFPRFKPDFNLDLARSIPYVDGFVLLKQTALAPLDFSEGTGYGAEQIEVVFQMLDTQGAGVIGHVPDLVCHLRLSCHRAMENTQRQQAFVSAVEKHLARNQIMASVLPGEVNGSFRVVYQHDARPLVSIIIPTKDQLEMLQRCVESLLEKTTYTHYEILLVDNNSETEEAKAYLAGLRALGSDQIRVLSYPEPFDFSAINNMAAKEARGEYLILLNNDTAIIRGNWLEEMLHHALRSEVGIVGAKLLYPEGTVQHAGVITGLRGPADHPGFGAKFDHSGYMHRLLLDQNYSVVTAACLMIRKSVYEQVGGMDEQDFKICYNDVDLCLKAGQAGYLVVWTPYSVVLHEGSVSLYRVNPHLTEAKLLRHEKEKIAMYRKWLPQIAHDPAYNKNLTLSGKGFELEARPQLSWSPLKWHPLPVVYCHPGDQSGCGQYRIIQPFNALESASLVTGAIAFDLLPAFELAKLAPDSLIFQRQITEEQIEILRTTKLFSPAFKVYELDDYLINVPMKSAHRGHMPKDVMKSLRKALTFTDRFVVSTDELANAYQDLHPVIHVVNNYLPVSRWGDLVSERRTGKKPRVGWAGGISHTGDLELISSVVQALENEVEWVFFGMCPDKLRPFVHEFHRGLPIELYPAKLASLNLDLALAPLEHNIFNLCKSNLRLLEYGACGFPVICTDIAPYQCDLPVTRVKNRHKDWVDAIRDHLADLDATAERGDALKAAVLKDWMLEGANLDKWRAAWLPE